ncbi:MAG: RodZ domain-containing protein [Armatimonadota bacterium]
MTTRSSGRGRADTSGIGHTLRITRTERGLSLADLQARTKVRARYLSALEDERFEDLPPYPFARGFLHTMAMELGLDPEPLTQRLAAAMSGAEDSSVQNWRRLDAAIVPGILPSRRRRLAVSAGVAIIVIGGGLAIYFAQQLREFSQPPPAATPQSSAETPGPQANPGAQERAAVPSPPGEPGTQPATQPDVSPAPAGTAVPGAADLTAAPGTSPDQAADGVTLDLQASGRSWLRVVGDNQPVFEGFVSAGESRRWQSRTSMSIRVGNAGAVALVVNGRSIGVLGQPGEVVNRTFPKDESR